MFKSSPIRGPHSAFCKNVFWNLKKAAISPNSIDAWSWKSYLNSTSACDQFADLSVTRAEIDLVCRYSVISAFVDNVNDVATEVDAKFKGFSDIQRIKHRIYKMTH